jgi:protein involved in polysaccharide export with SLBB domain
MKLRLALALAALAAVACRTPSAATQPLPGESDGGSPQAGVLGKNDVVEVRVFQEPDFSGVYRVSSAGTMDFPFCKNLPVLGLTPEEVAAKLTVCLAPGVLKNPQITVAIREYNSKKIFVVGEVQKPGTFPYSDNMNIIEAITLAGGFTKTAAKNSTNLTRIVEGQEAKQKIQVEDIAEGKAPNVTLLPGDIIYVPESFF